MNQIQSWNPFKELEAMQNRFTDLFNGTYRSLPEMNKGGVFYPAMDISEDKEGFHFKMDLPEVKKEDIKVECQDGVLTISGQKKFENETKNDDKKYHRIERSYGTFMRSFTLPEAANAEKVFAEYNNGVLDVKIAKRMLAAPSLKTIPIK